MKGLDTNVLVRYLVQDDPAQSKQADDIVEGAAAAGEKLFLGAIVLCELVWVLESAYGVGRGEFCPLPTGDTAAIRKAAPVAGRIAGWVAGGWSALPRSGQLTANGRKKSFVIARCYDTSGVTRVHRTEASCSTPSRRS
ncbi:MAG: PIN domain-containing protein [Deferrisomatales bacterium]